MPTWAKDEVQEASSGRLPEGLAQVRVVSQEETESANGKFAIKVETRVKSMLVNGQEQPQYKNMPFRFTFYIGTDSDLKADKKETWLASFAAKRYKSYLRAANIPVVGNTEEECDAAPGAELMVQVQHRSYERDGETRTTAEPSAFMPIGDVSSEHTRANGLDKGVKRVAPVVAAKKVAAVEAYADDDE